MRNVDFAHAQVIRATASGLLRCACPCEKAGHRGACQIWMWPGQAYYLALVGPPTRRRRCPLCPDCLEALQHDGLSVAPGLQVD